MKHQIKPSYEKLTMLALFALLSSHLAQADDSEIATIVSVKTSQITQTTLQRYVQAYGLVEPEPASHNTPAASAKIASPVAGIISQWFCEEGQRVKKGAPLLVLDSRAADDQVAKAKVALAFAQKNAARKQQLQPGATISQKLYDDAQQLLEGAQADLQSAQTQRALLTVTAPMSGVITAVHFRVGEAISTSSVLADILDGQRLAVVLHVPSAEAADVRLGQSVSLSSGKNDGQAGAVSFISQQIDPLTDTVLVRVTPGNSDLKAGQFIHASIVVEARQNRLAVPIASVVNHADGATVALVEGDQAKQQAVSTGLRDGDLIEISGAGLQAGMTVVSQGAYGLPPETRIRVQP